ncbi:MULTISPECIES: SAM-dependent methyltransferase [unclassified Herbaspirillum]|uniref:SAM-dependent methyltransferase n=1 Tax=unclassified Herbaspirillum TaxID=2624150 RepID=UPI0011514B02|nr:MULTISPECIES: SAM-dependent methyltransferase [unclassified Herbaspirillum]MBB5390466.1 SAM-dependent methyltransferase [Herbaspirillum sp. SJZ102]TQK09039.1 nodulation protein S (NodS) [Herbaspirillum sp. SJZ130]TQK14274.1 nodulation protein S (NodS) [Herbaspirillum sp. SJZ106]
MTALATTAEHFRSLYASSADPWHTADSWYERRKLSILLATLPKPRFSSVYEPGCGNGALTVELAGCCERLLASDLCDEAVRLTLERVNGNSHVQVSKECLPEQWPVGGEPAFDLIVLSELCYYLDDEQLRTTVSQSVDSLLPAGHLLACHWKRPFDDRQQETAAIHALFTAHGALRVCAHYEDEEFRLDIWQKRSTGEAA